MSHWGEVQLILLLNHPNKWSVFHSVSLCISWMLQLQAKTLLSHHWLNTHFWLQVQIQHSGTRKINKYIFTILHYNVPDFKYVRFLWHGNHCKNVTNKIIHLHDIVLFLTFTTIFTSGTLYTVIVIALFLHILWDAGLHPLIPLYCSTSLHSSC